MDSKASGSLRVDACWDIETAHWDEFVVGAMWVAGDGVTIYRNEDDLAAALLALPKGWTAWAHAGGRYDVLWLLDWCYRHDCMPNAQIRMSGSTISALQIAGGPILRDSFRLVPMSLAKASRIFRGGTTKGELSLPCVCGKDCKGFCQVTRDMSADVRAKVESYLVQDVESLRDCLLGLVDFAQANRLIVKGTVASSSWASARLVAELPKTDWDLRAYRFARRGYYGGRTEVGITEAPTVECYDRSAAYPAELRRAVPCGDMRLVSDDEVAARVWSRNRPGIYDVTVRVPDMLSPPLPYRVAGRIAYPHGTFRGVWPRDEIHHAEECGAKVERVHAALVWAREEAILRPYVEHVWRLRDTADPDTELGRWLKWLANSLTGAFAQDPEQDLFALGDHADDPKWSAVGVRDWIWKRTVFRVADRAHVQWAATLTGGARVELHQQILHAGDGWCYSDTDSVKSLRPLTRNVGTGLGEWKYEGAQSPWIARAPKVYRQGEEAKAKGVSDASKHWGTLLSGGTVWNEAGVKSFLTAVKGEGPLFVRNKTRRRLAELTDWCGARLRDGTRTRAPSVAELADLP